jgi:hypothetical protein
MPQVVSSLDLILTSDTNYFTVPNPNPYSPFPTPSTISHLAEAMLDPVSRMGKGP